MIANIFVHHSGVSVNREQYKYLVQGEYVEFNLSKSDNDEHEWQATSVTGIGSSPLMCETRFVSRQSVMSAMVVRMSALVAILVAAVVDLVIAAGTSFGMSERVRHQESTA